MPYIEQKDRIRLKIANDPKTEGELNFLLTLEYIRLIEDMGESYTNYGKIVSAITFLIFELNLLRSKIGNPTKYNNIEVRIKTICGNYFNNNKENKPKSDIMSEIIGALTNSSSEFYRRKIAPYENLAIKRNGDVYD